MLNGPTGLKASEHFRVRLVSRYISAAKDLARPDPGLDITDSTIGRAANFTPKPSTDATLNAFAQLVLLRLNASHALISLIDSSRQHVLTEAARSSFTQDEGGLWIGSVVLPRETGICEVVLPNSVESASYQAQNKDIDPDMIIINDLKEDRRFCMRRFVVSGPQMRFYAGSPIRSPDGAKIGALCVFDVQPRQGLSPQEKLSLCETAKAVMNHLEALRTQAEYQRRERLIEGLQAFVSGLSELTSRREDPTDADHAGKDLTTPHVSYRSDVSSTRSLEMWETALPSGCKMMFSRAANIVKAAGGYEDRIADSPFERMPDGAAFFYVPSVKASGTTSSHQEELVANARLGTRQSPASESSASSSAAEESPNATESQPDQNSVEEPSSSDETGSDTTCPILGFSLSQAEEQIRISSQLQFPRFLVRDMQKLMGPRPRGRIYLLDDLSTALPGDTSSSGSGADIRLPEYQGTTGSAPPVHTKRHKKRRAVQVKALLKLEPRARAFVCLPLWDYNRQRWFAFNICWILTPTRDPGVDQDLRFLQVFGNSITNALAHLDSLEEVRAKDSFVSSVSHELRSPLHGILGATNFLYDSSLGRFQREMVDAITSCGRTLLDSLEHVMDFAKINNFSKTNNNILSKATGPRKQQLESRRKKILAASSLTSSVDMTVVVEEVVEAIALGFTVQHGFLHSEEATARIGVQIPTFTTKPQDLSKSNRTASIRGRVRLCLDLPAGNSNFETQPGAWRRIIMNLVGNALKYTNEGFINVSLHLQDGDSGPVSQLLDGSIEHKGRALLVLTIKDSGIGMSNEYMQNHVFKAFSQEDSLAVGTGLGLSIVHQVVSSMGGHVEDQIADATFERTSVASAKGIGSTFSVHVPLDKGESNAKENARADPVTCVAKRLQGLRICILENINSKGSKKNSDSTFRAEEQFSRSLIRTLRNWFGIDALVVSHWTAQSADLVICLEPSFRQLQSVRSLAAGHPTPPVLFIAHDALEVAVLRADSRVVDQESPVEITYQPLGPRKLATALLHCLDRSHLASQKSSQEPFVPEQSRTHYREDSLGTSSLTIQNMRSDPLRASTLERTLSQSLNNPAALNERNWVLCVDDNPLNLRLLTTFVKKRKLPFEQAVNGQEAVDAYISAPGSFRCVLMDISMPIMDGMTATRLIREHETKYSLPRVPIFALTGLASAAARNEALEAGIDQLFTKPVPFTALTEILSQSNLPTGTDVDSDRRGPIELSNRAWSLV